MACDCDDVRSLEALQKEYYCNALAVAGVAVPDYEYVSHTVCDLVTDTWHYVTTPYIDGVASAVVSVDSGIPCSELQPIEPIIKDVSVCDAVTGTIHVLVNQYVYNDPSDLTDVTVTQLSDTDTLVKCNEDDIELVKTNWLPICVDGVEWYVQDVSLYNSKTGIESGVAKSYKEGADGAIVTVAPTGLVITEGYCPAVVTPSVQVDQTHVLVSGTGNVPAGLKTVTINNITGITTINGGFELGNGRRVTSISFDATELSEVRGLLPSYTLAGGTFQWVGLQPINEQ